MERPAAQPPTTITESDAASFAKGQCHRLHAILGPHVPQDERATGCHFGVWAPHAESVSVAGDFNQWECGRHRLAPRSDGSGLWEGFVPEARSGQAYAFAIRDRTGGNRLKGDPLARRWRLNGDTAASLIDGEEYRWKDRAWMERRAGHNSLDAPWCIYEVHAGSWRRVPGESNRWLTYREWGEQLADYAADMGFTHVQLLPLMEHDDYASFGYRPLGLFAPTCRYGAPADLKYAIDCLHQRGVGVLMQWPATHFSTHPRGLGHFDGAALYEHAAECAPAAAPCAEMFNFDTGPVQSFLLSSAYYWLHQFHLDGLQLGNTRSMLFLDAPETAQPAAQKGVEDMGGIELIRHVNEVAYGEAGAIQTVAEQAGVWPMTSRPTYVGGLGFGMSWREDWAQQTVEYFSTDPLYRKYRHDDITARLGHSFAENYLLPLSHDMSVDGQSLLGRMHGDEWQKRANLRLLFGFTYAHPGKKLLFMGDEFGQWQPWDADTSLDWHLTEDPRHQGIQRWVRDLNTLYRGESSLHYRDFREDGFEWMDNHDWEQSVFSFVRKDPVAGRCTLVVCNCTPVARHNYRVGLPRGGPWREVLNSDAELYGGANYGNFGTLEAAPVGAQGRFHSLPLTLPPLAILFLQPLSANA